MNGFMQFVEEEKKSTIATIPELVHILPKPCGLLVLASLTLQAEGQRSHGSSGGDASVSRSNQLQVTVVCVSTL